MAKTSAGELLARMRDNPVEMPINRPQRPVSTKRKGVSFKKVCEREGCGVEFMARPSEYRKYCSRECATIRWSAMAHDKHAVKCANPECSTEFLKPPSSIQKYCSRKCSAVHGAPQRAADKERIKEEMATILEMLWVGAHLKPRTGKCYFSGHD